VVDNSLIDLGGGDGTLPAGVAGIDAHTVIGGLTTTVDARQVTIRNGGNNSFGVYESDNGNAGANVTVGLTDSIIRDVSHPIDQASLVGGTTVTLNADHDDYDQTLDQPSPPGAGQVRNETNLLNVDPLFVNPITGANGITGDYRLSANSPVIDQGDSAPLGTGETDLAGLSRIVDGAGQCTMPVRDLGAYEFQGACTPVPVPSPTTTTTTSQTGPTGLQAAALKKCKKVKGAAKRRKCKRRARRLPL
jgi:hypothetical protein